MNDSDDYRIHVPSGRDMAAAIRFSAEIASLDHKPSVSFSFRDVDFVNPGWMLLMIRTLRTFRESRPGTRCRVVETSSEAMSYAGRAKFFDSLGVKWAAGDTEASQTSTFLPITPRKVRDLFAGQPLIRPAGDIIQEDAERLAAILSQTQEGILFDTLSYSIREIIRNVVEHSESPEFLIAAQCWPALGKAEIAIADAGIGIHAGLTSNSKYNPKDDAEALSLATQPGVSGAIISRYSDDAWANSGYGLYMAKGLADGKQGFTLVSGNAGLTAGNDNQLLVDGSIKGTCVSLSLKANAIPLEKRLSELIADRGGAPSRASMSAKVKPERD